MAEATRLFLSHSTQDNAWCRVLLAALKNAGYDVWYDEQGLTGGAQWVETLQREVQARDVFVTVLSPDAAASPWVREEIRLAIATRRTILPVMLKPTRVEGFLMTRQWVDVTGMPPEDGARKVLAALSSPVVFPAPPAPKQITPASQIVPPTLQPKGFTGWAVDDVAVIRPPVVDVPAGSFLMGSDPAREPDAADSEQPRRVVQVAAFQIGVFPVTVAEYYYAVRAEAVRPPSNWERQMPRPDHPVVSISWKAALAYAAWLAKTTGERWRPPTEEE